MSEFSALSDNRTARVPADGSGHRVPARVRAGAQKRQAGKRAGEHQRLPAAGQLRRVQAGGPRPHVHAVRHARLHGPRTGHVQGLRPDGGLLEPGRCPVRDGGRPSAVRRARRRRPVREHRARPLQRVRVVQPAAPESRPRTDPGESCENIITGLTCR